VARVTVEDCLERISNRFALVILAAQRARQIAKGSPMLVPCNNKPAVAALREIAEGKVRFVEDIRSVVEEYLREMRHRTIARPTQGQGQ